MTIKIVCAETEEPAVGRPVLELKLVPTTDSNKRSFGAKVMGRRGDGRWRVLTYFYEAPSFPSAVFEDAFEDLDLESPRLEPVLIR